MASLKELKTRIASVKNTLKITSAMKLVASAKLHKAQMAIEGMQPYNERLTSIAHNLLASEPISGKYHSPLMEERQVKRAAIVAVSSSTSLCGGFNNNLIRLTRHVTDEYREKGAKILFVPIGRKVAQALTATSIQLQAASDQAAQASSLAVHSTSLITDYVSIGEKPSYSEASALASYLTELYLAKEIDCVEFLYTHYKNMAVQVLMRKQFLPMEIPSNSLQKEEISTTMQEHLPFRRTEGDSFLLEPSAPELLADLLPQALSMHMFTVLLDSSAAEHAARTFAMQTATDNGEGLLQELNLQYNKGRQQAITNELLDIMGGSLR